MSLRKPEMSGRCYLPGSRISVGGEQYILMTQLLAAIPISTLNGPVGSAETQREEIVAAIDLIFTAFDIHVLSRE